MRNGTADSCIFPTLFRDCDKKDAICKQCLVGLMAALLARILVPSPSHWYPLYRLNKSIFKIFVQLSKTWTQIGKATEKISSRYREAETCYRKAAEYAEQSGHSGLQLKALSLLLDVQETLKSVHASQTRERFTTLQRSAGILCVDDVDSEDITAEQPSQVTCL